MFAVVETSGTQYKVSPGDKIVVDRIKTDENADISLDNVMLIQGDKEGDTVIGTPYIDKAKVEAKVLRHFRGDKIRVFKMKAKKRYRRVQGFKPEYTELEITGIKK